MKKCYATIHDMDHNIDLNYRRKIRPLFLKQEEFQNSNLPTGNNQISCLLDPTSYSEERRIYIEQEMVVILKIHTTWLPSHIFILQIYKAIYICPKCSVQFAGFLFQGNRLSLLLLQRELIMDSSRVTIYIRTVSFQCLWSTFLN